MILRKRLFARCLLVSTFFFAGLQTAVIAQESRVNLAQTYGTVTANATLGLPGYEADLIIDGDLTTAWSAGRLATVESPTWVTVDLQDQREVVEIVLLSPDADGNRLGESNDYELYVSSDNENWTFIGSGTLYDSSVPGEYSDSYDFSSDKLNIRYIRYQAVGGEHYGHLFEMEVYEEAGSNPKMNLYFSEEFDDQLLSQLNIDNATSGLRWCGNAWREIALDGCSGWFASTPFGSIDVDQGIASFQSNGGEPFPFVYRGTTNFENIVPESGDFSIELRVRRDSYGSAGTGIKFVNWDTDLAQQNSGPPRADDSVQTVFSIWRDISSYSSILGSYVSNDVVDEDFHEFRLVYEDGSYLLFIDNVLRGGPIQSDIRPTSVLLGNGLHPGASGVNWSEFAIDYIRVYTDQPVVEEYTLSVSLPQVVTPQGVVLVEKARITFEDQAGELQTVVCKSKGGCSYSVPAGNLVVGEILSIGTFTDSTDWSLDTVHLDTSSSIFQFTMDGDHDLYGGVPLDHFLFSLDFPNRSRDGNWPKIVTEVTTDDGVYECTSKRKRCNVLVPKSNPIVYIEELEGDASYSILGEIDTFRPTISLVLDQNMVMYASNGEAIGFIPGLANSYSGEMFCDNFTVGLLAAVSSDITREGLDDGQWHAMKSHIIPFLDGMRKRGFQINVLAYDWRKHAEDLETVIAEFIRDQYYFFGTRINIVAFSYGGITSRQYLQGSQFDASIVGAVDWIAAPMSGSANSVKPYYGGQFESGSWSNQDGAKAFGPEAALNAMKIACGVFFQDYEFDYQIIREVMPSFHATLPTTEYFVHGSEDAQGGVPTAIGDMCVQNQFLDELNMNAGILHSRGLKMKTFAGMNKKTVVRYANSKPAPLLSTGCDLGAKWTDQKPKKKYKPKNAGDSTVTLASACPGADIPAFESIPREMGNGKHLDLLGKNWVLDGVAEHINQN